MSLKGKIVVFTGTLELKRNDAKGMAEKAGATVAGSISGKTQLVVAGTQAGSKLDDAKARGIEIWDEAKFVAICKGGKAAPAPKPAATSRKTARENADDGSDEDEPKTKKPRPQKLTPSSGGKVKHALHAVKWNKAPLGHFIGLALSTPVVVGCGWQFFHRAFTAARHRSASMDTLVSIGVGGAWGFSFVILILECASVVYSEVYFNAAAELVTFMIFGKYLEARAKKGTSGALLQLMSLAPSKAILVGADGNEREVETDAIQINDTVRVPAGCRIPIDGVVTKGSAAVDEQLITGESVPVDKVPGDRAIAGTLCLNTDLLIKATSIGDQTTLARILRVVQAAQTTKPGVQRIADRIASVFVPCIIGYAIAVLVVWLAVSYEDAYPEDWRDGASKFIFSFEFFLSSIVVACPCALGLSVPTAVMVGTGIGATNGILIKDGPTLEKAKAINVVLFDKTGTLTTGHLTVATNPRSPSPWLSASQRLLRRTSENSSMPKWR